MVLSVIVVESFGCISAGLEVCANLGVRRVFDQQIMLVFNVVIINSDMLYRLRSLFSTTHSKQKFRDVL